MAENITKESLYSSIDGLASFRNSPVSNVTNNNSNMDVSPLSGLDGFHQADGTVTVDDVLNFMESENSLSSEFFGENVARLEDGHLIIEPRNVGSKGFK